METNEKHKPAHEVKIGNIKAAIWANPTKYGVRFGVTVCRIYKDGANWKSTNSFDRDNLLVLGKVIDEAHSWIHKQATGKINLTPTTIAEHI